MDALPTLVPFCEGASVIAQPSPSLLHKQKGRCMKFTQLMALSTLMHASLNPQAGAGTSSSLGLKPSCGPVPTPSCLPPAAQAATQLTAKGLAGAAFHGGPSRREQRWAKRLEQRGARAAEARERSSTPATMCATSKVIYPEACRAGPPPTKCQVAVARVLKEATTNLTGHSIDHAFRPGPESSTRIMVGGMHAVGDPKLDRYARAYFETASTIARDLAPHCDSVTLVHEAHPLKLDQLKAYMQSAPGSLPARLNVGLPSGFGTSRILMPELEILDVRQPLRPNERTLLDPLRGSSPLPDLAICDSVDIQHARSWISAAHAYANRAINPEARHVIPPTCMSAAQSALGLADMFREERDVPCIEALEKASPDQAVVMPRGICHYAHLEGSLATVPGHKLLIAQDLSDSRFSALAQECTTAKNDERMQQDLSLCADWQKYSAGTACDKVFYPEFKDRVNDFCTDVANAPLAKNIQRVAAMMSGAKAAIPQPKSAGKHARAM